MGGGVVGTLLWVVSVVGGVGSGEGAEGWWWASRRGAGGVGRWCVKGVGGGAGRWGRWGR